MLARTAALFVIIIAGCAGPQRKVQLDSMTRSGTGLFVGHSTHGDVVLAANHYDAMTGLATTDEDLGLAARKTGDGQMLCSRETPTGTNVPRWSCRYEQDIRDSRQVARDFLDQPRLSFAGRGALPTISSGRGPGSGGRGTLAP
jgi:hypothetical protein